MIDMDRIIGDARHFTQWDLSDGYLSERIIREMPDQLDEIDLKLLAELERDADRPNVELARLVGLSPAATFNRVRRLKSSGVISAVVALHRDARRPGQADRAAPVPRVQAGAAGSGRRGVDLPRPPRGGGASSDLRPRSVPQFIGRWRKSCRLPACPTTSCAASRSP